MEINISNYEIWLIDWLDGNLNDHQVEQVRIFLYENPGLMEEFNEFNTLRLTPSGKSFPPKEKLIKSISDLSDSQFEYLCVAYLENDVSSDQQNELIELIGHDPEKKKSFELIQKIRLDPGNADYVHKKNLYKITPVQKAVRLSFIGLSVAATVALILLIKISIPLNQQNKLRITANNIAADSTLLKPFVPNVSVETLQHETPVITKQKRENQIAAVQKKSPVITRSVPSLSVFEDRSARKTDNADIKITKVPVLADIVLIENHERNTLVASNSIFILPEFDDERSKLSKFIARTFRDKLLKEPISKDSPLKAYEIAEAGVAGLNKLLGWEMALEEKKDDNGEMTSVYFSSRILKFNAPVKKTEALP